MDDNSISHWVCWWAGSVYRAWNKRDPDHPGKWLNNISYLAREVTNAPDNMWVGYLDGNKQNCRSYNLVLVTPQESCLNRRQPTRTHVRPSSGYRGVIRAPRMASYYVQIKGGVLRDSDNIPIKFPDPADAARAYDAKAKEYWGDKAVLNFPH